MGIESYKENIKKVSDIVLKAVLILLRSVGKVWTLFLRNRIVIGAVYRFVGYTRLWLKLKAQGYI